jgi:L-ribulose-5-phosphate 3-epimerase
MPARDSRRGFFKKAVGIVALPAALGVPSRLLAASSAATGGRHATITGFSACCWSLGDKSPKVFETARAIGLDGVEIDFGDPPEFAIDTREKRSAYKEAAKTHGVVVSSLAIGCLNIHPLKTDAQAPAWVAMAIEAAADFGVRVLLVPFFGHGELKTKAEKDRVGDILKDLGPLAEKKKITLGLENTLSATETLAIMERAGSPAVRVYYDTGNSRHWGHNAVAEIRRLGQNICAFHFKDGIQSHGDARMGEGKVDFPAIATSINAIGYTGWITLECKAPDLIPDMQAALVFSKRLSR